MSETRRTIRFEDLGEPVQRLLRSLKGGVSDEDMALLEFVSVKDMAKIYSEMSSDRQAAEIWEELRAALQARREKSERKRVEIERRQEDLDRRQEEEQRAAEQEEAERLEREKAEAERQRRREERRRRREEEARAAAAEEAAAEEARLAAEQEAREEAERLAAEEADRKRREAKKKRRDARARELREEQEEIEAERKKNHKQGGNTQKEWADYVASHPLEFPDPSQQEIQQVKVEHDTNAPPKVTTDLLNRSYTPQCPNCNMKFARPPPEWDCPICLRRLRNRIKVWQPDETSDVCMICKTPVGRFSRHHCRSCGRIVCGKCSQGKAIIPGTGYASSPVKACSDCISMITSPTPTSPTSPTKV